MHSRFSISLLILFSLSLAGCNGQEDFSDAILGGPIIDGINPNPNFNPDNACESRVVGNLVDGGIIANIGYECGGYRDYTGNKGIPGEIAQKRFVCPLYSTSVTFFLGGKNDPREYLGTANFRIASPAPENLDEDGNNNCQYNVVSQEYETGSVYDADGPYLFSLADLYDGPVRVDVITDNEPNEQAAQNLSALLAGLDTSTDESLVQIDDEAHRIILDVDFAFPDDFFDKPFADFVANDGDAQDYLDLISAGAKNPVWPPAEGDVETVLAAANTSTAAGIYQFNMRPIDYVLVGYLSEYCPTLTAAGNCAPPTDSIYNADVLLTEFLVETLQAPEMAIDPSDTSDPPDVSSIDLVPFIYEQDYRPFTVVDRHGRLIGGGSFDVLRVTKDGTGHADGTEHLCGNQPVYLALEGAASLSADLTFEDMKFVPVTLPTSPESGSAEIPGRFIEGVAYSGVKDESNAESKTDYELAYDAPPHEFNPATDSSLINAESLCGSTFTDQIILSYRRQGIVMPALDPEIMDYFFGASGPGRYTLDYRTRLFASDPEPNGDSKGTLGITIHVDGSIFTDLNGDGNLGYNSDQTKAVPAGEYVVGMVSSVVAGENNVATDPINEAITEAVINILVFTLAPESESSTLPAYGSHFRARLSPVTDCAANTNALSLPGDDSLSSQAYWFDTYNITNWLRETTDTTTPEQRYDALRTIAYGYIEGVRTDCP